jgi:hypothetical protein
VEGCGLPYLRQLSGSACLLLSSPQFVGVEQLLYRLTSVLPNVPVSGGQARHGHLGLSEAYVAVVALGITKGQA